MDYAFLSGLIKYLEIKMLDYTDMERMVDTENADSAFRVFNDTDYADNILDVETINYQQALDDDLKQVKSLFEKHVDKNLLKFLFVKYDAHNIKLFFKEKYSKKDLYNAKSDLGMEDADKLRTYIQNLPNLDGKNSPNLDPEIKNIIIKTMEFIGAKPFPHRIDYIVDKAYFRLLTILAKKIKSKYIKNFLKLQIDIVNLKIFVRARLMEKPFEFVEKKFIESGGMESKFLKSLYVKPLDEAIEFFKEHFGHKELNYVFDHFKKDNGSFWRIEKALENLEMDYIKKARIIPYGPEVVLGYYYAKKNAGRNVRLIMTGKINNIASEEIKERISKLY